MGSIYKCNMNSDEASVLEELRTKIAGVAGVTLTGNRLTVRWYKDGQLVNVHMLIESVYTPKEVERNRALEDTTSELLSQHPDVEEELYFIEHGEHSK